MRKIYFEINEKSEENSPEDWKIYNDSLDELEDLSDKKVFFLKDEKTMFVSYREGFLEDIKKVFLIIRSEKINIKIKGNLSFSRNDGSLKFYPLFVDKYDNKNENRDFWYKVNINEFLGSNERRSERQTTNKKLFENLLDDFKKEEFTPIIADIEWKNFIEPYEYYAELKFQLLKQDFIMLENFPRDFKKVILLERSSEYKTQFESYLTEERYLDLYEDNRKSQLLLDFEKNKMNFSENFLKKNTFNLLTRTYEVTKSEFKKVSKQSIELNRKFNTNLNKSSFFSTNEIYSSEDIRKDGKLSKKDIELEVEFAYIPDLKEKYNNIDTNVNKINNIINEFKPLNFNIKNLEIKSFEKIYENLKRIFEILLLLKKNISITKKEINSKLDSILDEEILDAKNMINEIDQLIFLDFNDEKAKIEMYLSDFYNNKKYFDDEKEKFFSKIDSQLDELKEEIHDKKKKLKEENKKSNQKKNNNSNDKSNEESIQQWKNDIYNLKEEIKILEKKKEEKEKEIELISEKKLLKFKEEIESNLKNRIEKKIKEQISEIEKLKLVLDKIIRTVTYEQNINILFNFKKNNNDQKIKENIYMINIGDMVLVDTIKKIILKIKRGDKLNSEILNKIIGKTDLKKFNDFEIDLDKNVPKEYFNLNDSQKKAFKLSIDKSESISIIQGPPGTGKTEVITNIMKYYRNKGIKVILSSQTNVAIKNVLDKLCSEDKIENSMIVPWLTSKGREKYSIENIQNTWYEKFISNVELSKFEFVKEWKRKKSILKKEEEFFKNFSLIKDAKGCAATTTTSVTLNNGGYNNYNYLNGVEVLIIDEVSKSILPEILRYALDVKKVILVGDYKQLNPIFDLNKEKFDDKVDENKFAKIKKIIESGIFYSLAKEAKKVDRIATLNVNYRSVPGVLNLYNVFYQDDINPTDNSRGLSTYRKFDEYSSNYKFDNSIYFDSKYSSYFFNIVGSKEKEWGTSRYNPLEAEKMIEVLHDLANSLKNSKKKNVAIIFPYAAQIKYFSDKMKSSRNKKLRDNFKSLEWDTVDSFQGSEADIVFLSTVITTRRQSFLQDFRRVNVSMSRAKDMLIIFGDAYILKSIEIGGEGIKTDKYFSKILDSKKNPYLKVIKITNEKIHVREK